MAEASGETTRLLLTRHAQSTWNALGRWQGHSDPELSPLGERQARAARVAVRSIGTSHVVTSDLRRAHQTARLLAPVGTNLIVEPALRERDVGEWAGLTAAEIDERFPGMRAARRHPPGFEDDESLLSRALPALTALSRGLRSAVAVVVTHGGVIRTLERHLGAPSAPVPNLGGRWVFAWGTELALGDREVLIDPDDATLTVPTEQ